MHPILIEIGPLTFGSYGVMVLVAAFVGIALIPRYARRHGIDPGHTQTLMIWVFVGGSLGCRLLNVLLRFDEVIAEPRVGLWLLQQAGVWYGALIAGTVTAVVLCRRFHLPVIPVLDAVAVPVVIGGGLGRIGCLLSGCCFGTSCEWPWAITYTNAIAHRLHPDLPYGPLHPTPVYELLATLAIALVLDRFGARPRRPGDIALLWFALYGVARSIVEIFRGDAIRGTLIGPLSTSQSIGLIVALICVGIVVMRRVRTPRDAAAVAPVEPAESSR